jgi:alpha-L-fucosidase
MLPPQPDFKSSSDRHFTAHIGGMPFGGTGQNTGMKNVSGTGRFMALSVLAILSGAIALAQGADGSDAAEPWLQQRLDWFQDQKFGLMMHWGIYSQWGCIESWPLVEEDTWARPDDLPAWTERHKDYATFKRDYLALARTFNPTNFDPAAWATIAHDAGMKYVVFTTKHHDGFCLFDTRLSDFRVTATDVPFHNNSRSNIVREVFSAFRNEGFGIGAYFSKADWHSPYYWSTNWPAHTRNPNYDTHEHPELWSNFVAFTYGQIQELMSGYGPIDILWLDAGQVRPPDQDIQMDRLAAMARHYQPHLILVDRTVGGRYENYRTPEQEVPDKPLPYAWETCMTMGTQWSFKPHDQYKSSFQLIHLLVDIVGKGGNFLLNVGPQPDGRLPEAAGQRMEEIGAWLKINGDAIYGTRPIAPYKDGEVVFTRKGKDAFAIYLPGKEGEGLPARISFHGLKPKPGSEIRLLSAGEPVSWQVGAGDQTVISIPETVRKAPGCDHAFVFKFQPLEQ